MCLFSLNRHKGETPSPKIISLKHFTSMAATLQNYSPAAFSIAANITLKLIMPAILKQESLATWQISGTERMITTQEFSCRLETSPRCTPLSTLTWGRLKVLQATRSLWPPLQASQSGQRPGLYHSCGRSELMNDLKMWKTFKKVRQCMTAILLRTTEQRQNVFVQHFVTLNSS